MAKRVAAPKEPASGDLGNCDTCGNEIQFVVIGDSRFWLHKGGRKSYAVVHHYPKPRAPRG